MLPPVDRMPTAPPIAPIKVGGAIGKATGSFIGSASGGGYVFTEEEVDGLIKEWEDLLLELQTDEQHAENIRGVKGPGKEFASGDFQEAANKSGDLFLKQYDRMQKYVGEYIEALKKAKEKTATENEQAVDAVTTAGDGV